MMRHLLGNDVDLRPLQKLNVQLCSICLVSWPRAEGFVVKLHSAGAARLLFSAAPGHLGDVTKDNGLGLSQELGYQRVMV